MLIIKRYQDISTNVAEAYSVFDPYSAPSRGLIVGTDRLELSTFSVSARCSNQTELYSNVVDYPGLEPGTFAL